MEKQRNFFLSNPFLFSVFFILGLCVYEFSFFSQSDETTFLLGYIAKGIYLKPLLHLALSVVSIILAGFFVWAALISPYKFRILYFVGFCLAIMTEYSYQGVFACFTDLKAIENLFFAADQQMIVNAIVWFFNYIAIIPCTVFGILLIFVKPNQQKGSKYLSVIILLFGGFFSFTAYFTGNTYYTISIGAFYRTVISSQIIWYFGSHGQPSYSIYYYAPRFDVNFESENQPTKNIVFIVDETIRGDHLSLNGYSRPTTPLIDALNSKGFIKNWGIGASGATCSIQSNNLLLTGLNELRDAAGSKLYRLPTIFQYAKAMGYKTYYYDAQRSAVWNGKPTDLKYYERIDKVDFEAKTPTEIDAEIAVRVREKLENSTGNFIWINKFGNHMPYENNYPEDHVLWKPISTKNELATDRQPLINNYDNGIRYNLEIFFTNLFRNGVSNNTVYIYTSDHGESFVNQNGHCGTTKDEAIVPIFMIAQPHLLPGVDTGFKASHVNIFPTLLDLMEFPENQRQYNYALSLLKAKSTDSQPRFYYSERGEPNNPGKRYPFDE